jgi:hypothetical protein
MIAEIIPRNLPQYRSDEDFEREVEHRTNQINEYTTIEDLKGLYDAKLEHTSEIDKGSQDFANNVIRDLMRKHLLPDDNKSLDHLHEVLATLEITITTICV